MRKRGFGVTVVASLALLFLLAAMLIRSFGWNDGVTYYGDGWSIGAASLTDRFFFGYRHGTHPHQRGWEFGSLSNNYLTNYDSATDFLRRGMFGEQYSVSILGFGFGNGQRMGDRVSGVWLPMWFPIMLTLIAPAVWLRKKLRHARRRAAGLCVQCGYDIRESDKVCPECGGSLAFK